MSTFQCQSQAHDHYASSGLYSSHCCLQMRQRRSRQCGSQEPREIRKGQQVLRPRVPILLSRTTCEEMRSQRFSVHWQLIDECLQYELWWENREVPELGIIWADAADPEQPFVLSNGGEHSSAHLARCQNSGLCMPIYRSNRVSGRRQLSAMHASAKTRK